MTKYQIAVFQNGADDHARTLRETLCTRLIELGLDLNFVSFLDADSFIARDPKAPTVGVFISTIEGPKQIEHVAELVRSGTLVVPVVKTLKQFNQYVFADLHGINGMELEEQDPQLERVAAVLLEGLGLLRRSRRLFISYRRAETRGVAIQLYEILDQHGFDVFLDTVSVRPGEPFQEILWHRLLDTDVVVMLDSPNFLQSRWTVQELARANSTNIQMLQLVWPSHRLEEPSAFSKPVMLSDGDFGLAGFRGPDAQLTDVKAAAIVTEVESLRARALAARYAYLVQEFCGEATRLGLVPFLQPDRFITLERKPGRFIAVVPTVGAPDALRYQAIEDMLEKHGREHEDIVLLYDERGIQAKWLAHLSWLDKHLRVRSLQVAECSTWLRSLVV
jgi:hypothetical protein